MRYDYVVALKRENARKTDLVSLLLLIFSILAFAFMQFRTGLRIFPCLAILILIVGLVINLRKLKEKGEMKFRIWLFVAGVCWFGMPVLTWLGLPFFLLGLLEVQAKYPLEIGFNENGLTINSLLKKKIPWSSLQSVKLKDGILTLDFRNNTLIQKEVLDDNEPDADEDEFNEYCHSKLVNLP
jgi:hypothetical protein